MVNMWFHINLLSQVMGRVFTLVDQTEDSALFQEAFEKMSDPSLLELFDQILEDHSTEEISLEDLIEKSRVYELKYLSAGKNKSKAEVIDSTIKVLTRIHHELETKTDRSNRFDDSSSPQAVGESNESKSIQTDMQDPVQEQELLLFMLFVSMFDKASKYLTERHRYSERQDIRRVLTEDKMGYFLGLFSPPLEEMRQDKDSMSGLDRYEHTMTYGTIASLLLTEVAVHEYSLSYPRRVVIFVAENHIPNGLKSFVKKVTNPLAKARSTLVTRARNMFSLNESDDSGYRRFLRMAKVMIYGSTAVPIMIAGFALGGLVGVGLSLVAGGLVLFGVDKAAESIAQRTWVSARYSALAEIEGYEQRHTLPFVTMVSSEDSRTDLVGKIATWIETVSLTGRTYDLKFGFDGCDSSKRYRCIYPSESIFLVNKDGTLTESGSAQVTEDIVSWFNGCVAESTKASKPTADEVVVDKRLPLDGDPNNAEIRIVGEDELALITGISPQRIPSLEPPHIASVAKHL